MKLPTAAKDQQDECHQVKIDVDQEVAHDLASVEHVDEMSTTKYHQPDYMYKSEASYVIEFIRAKYKHCQTTKQGICYTYLQLGFEIKELIKVIRFWKRIRIQLNQWCIVSFWWPIHVCSNKLELIPVFRFVSH